MSLATTDDVSNQLSDHIYNISHLMSAGSSRVIPPELHISRSSSIEDTVKALDTITFYIYQGICGNFDPEFRATIRQYSHDGNTWGNILFLGNQGCNVRASKSRLSR